MNCDLLQKILNEITALSKTDWSNDAYKKAIEDTQKIGISQNDDFFKDIF